MNQFNGLQVPLNMLLNAPEHVPISRIMGEDLSVDQGFVERVDLHEVTPKSRQPTPSESWRTRDAGSTSTLGRKPAPVYLFNQH